MPSHRLRIEPPTAADLQLLPTWYEFAGLQRDPAPEVDEFTRAVTGGYLGAAVGNSSRRNFNVMYDLEPHQWYCSRTSIRILRLNDEPIGVLLMGADRGLWDLLDQRIAHESAPKSRDVSPGVMNFFVTALSMSKIHVLAVNPDQRGRGHGRKLVREAFRIGHQDGLSMLYGLFDTQTRPHLRDFYRANGFTVLEPGQPLTLGLATGNFDHQMIPPATESYCYSTTV